MDYIKYHYIPGGVEQTMKQRQILRARLTLPRSILDLSQYDINQHHQVVCEEYTGGFITRKQVDQELHHRVWYLSQNFNSLSQVNRVKICNISTT